MGHVLVKQFFVSQGLISLQVRVTPQAAFVGLFDVAGNILGSRR